MKKAIILLFIAVFTTASTTAWAQTDAWITKVAQKTCPCMEEKTRADKSQDNLAMQIGLCMILAANEVGPSEDGYKMVLTDEASMEKLGEKLGVKMVEICPDVFLTPEVLSLASEDNDKSKQIEGKIRSVESSDFLFLNITDSDKKDHRILVLNQVTGLSDFLNNPEKLAGKKVTAKYRLVEYYLPKNKGYVLMKELTELEIN